MADYYAIPTDIGEAKLANALALGIPLQITQLAVGDGEGLGAQGTPLPNPQQTALVSERRRAALNTLATDAQNANVLVAEQVIPEDVGGWWIREMGLFDVDGDLIAVCNTPPTYKPVLASGSGRTQVVRMQIIVSDVAAVTLKIDPAIVLATRQYVDAKTAPLAPSESPAFTGEPTAPTPPQFDDDTSIATTRFVQRALGNFQRALAVSVVGNFLPSDVGGAFYIEAAGTYGLPPLASLSQGAAFTFLATVNGVIIDPNGADQLLVGSAAASTLTLNNGDTVVLVKIGNFWAVVAGTAAGRGSTGDFGRSLNTSGYERLPGGRIRQWGTVGLPAVGNFNNKVLGGTTYYTNHFSITYPIAFKAMTFAVNATLACGVWGAQRSMAGESVTANLNGNGSPLTRLDVAITTPNLGWEPTIHWEVIGA